ncbi:potassium channel family protein [Natronorubrum thiooxidans]|uniref:Trk K+ transport system, NAD-binding component n=1 Tax=Natronorubrum thiooxidans TaxID=308853 RepID=A0A1N7DM50_9EURY|nr:NAD-binding protein [Natronorubrum thiooxidans]SIR76775.1 Trk K+ transport system, NAD-binding component [Natronorubrum thiooxidans]
MSLWKSRRTGYYLALVAATTVIFTLLYNYGMSTWEGRPQPLFRSLEIVFQTYTTTGYGEDAPWQTPQMNLLMIGMQLAGIGLILTAADVFAVPWLRNTLSPTPPTAVTDLEDHVVICEYTSRGETFVEELESRGQAYVIVESDDELATRLHEAGHRVVHGDPESVEVLENAGVERAMALVADSSDESSASIVLSAREVNPDVTTVTLVEDVSLAEYHRIAGADSVLSPRQLLGESLAHQVPTAVTTAVDDGIEIGNDLELVELSIESGSDLCNRTAGDVRLRDRFAVDIIGVWVDGEFESPIDPALELDDDVRLLVAGEPDRIAALREEATSSVQSFSPQRVLVAGYGEAGAVAADVLESTGAEVTVIDRQESEGVDVVGDAREPETFLEADIEDASAVIIAVNDDTTAIFTTLIASDLNPEIDVIVRANESKSEGKLYRAGAAYVQSLATVSGRMLASTIFEDESVLTFDKQIDVVRLPVGRLAGRTLTGADVRATTGCTVLVVVRDGELIAEFDPDTLEFDPDDEVIIAGTDESVRSFEQTYLKNE